MCLIVYQPHGKPLLEKAVFRNGWNNNPDGAGYMFAAAGKLVIRKPFYRMRDLWKAYKADHAEYGAVSPFVVHFRWATHGSKEAVNVHPHPLCDGKAGMVHNGILDIEPPYKADISDTVFFCRTVLAYRQPSFLIGRKCNRWLAELIGPSNKFVIMDTAGNVSIVNSESGVWDNGLWFSNSGYKPSLRSPLKGSRGSLGKWGAEKPPLFDYPDIDLKCDLAWDYLEDIGIDPTLATDADWREAIRETRDLIPEDLDKLDERCFQEACAAADRESDPTGWNRTR